MACDSSKTKTLCFRRSLEAVVFMDGIEFVMFVLQVGIVSWNMFAQSCEIFWNSGKDIRSDSSVCVCYSASIRRNLRGSGGYCYWLTHGFLYRCDS